MIEPRYAHSMTGSSNKKIIFVTGGFNQNDIATKTSSFYVITTQKWEKKLKTMKDQRVYHASIFISEGDTKGVLYVLGGRKSMNMSSRLRSI